MFVPQSKSRRSLSSWAPGLSQDSVTTAACKSSSLKVSINDSIFGWRDLALVE